MIIAGRVWAALTVAAAAVGVLIELLLVITGTWSVTADSPAPLGIRLWRFVSYFTVQSNLLVIVTVLPLIARPRHDGPRWRVLRLDGVIMITVTGVVNWLLLRGLVELGGWSAVGDVLVHLVAPASALIGWLVFGPRPRITPAVIGWSLVWPIGWLVYTLTVGTLTGWYPYPFLDVGELGAGRVALTCGALAVLFLGLATCCWRLERAMPLSEGPATIDP